MCKHLTTLLARRTPFSQAKSRVLTANTTIKQKSTEWCFLVLWSKCGGSNSGPHGPEPCALPAALHLDFGKILSFLQVVKSVVKVKFCEKYERCKVRKSQPVQGISGFWKSSIARVAIRSRTMRATSCATPRFFKQWILNCVFILARACKKVNKKSIVQKDF